MPTIDDAHRLAQRYAASESLRTGAAWRGLIEEFPDGWAVWTIPPEGELPAIGVGSKTVLDRETGELSHWPSWPTAVLAHEYAAARPNLRPQRMRNPLPALGRSVDFATVHAADGRIWRQHSAAADELPEHHPQVAQWLSELRPGSAVRGAERHAEMLVISEALYDSDPAALQTSTLRSSTQICDTCLQAAVHFGLLGREALAFIAPQPGALISGPPAFADGRSFDSVRWAQIAFELLSEAGTEGSIPPVEAARVVIERCPVATSDRRGVGRDCWIRPFHLGITVSLRRHAALLLGFGQLIGAALYPLGEEEGNGVIAIDERGRLFVLDQAGAWYCGPDIDTALLVLTEGHRPLRVRSDGSLDF